MVLKKKSKEYILTKNIIIIFEKIFIIIYIITEGKLQILLINFLSLKIGKLLIIS